MLARIRKSAEEKDQGFTLIELLVVMIIIGILAAIAIPVFLSQRNNGYRSAIQSDLRNAATAVESYAVVQGGNYTGLNNTVVWNNGAAVAGLPTGFEFSGSNDVTVTVTSGTQTDYTLTATHRLLSNHGEAWTLTKSTGGDPTPPAGVR